MFLHSIKVFTFNTKTYIIIVCFKANKNILSQFFIRKHIMFKFL